MSLPVFRLCLPALLAAAALAAPATRTPAAKPTPKPVRKPAPRAASPAAPAPPVPAAGAPAPALRGPVNVPELAAAQRLTLAQTPGIGEPAHAFDGNRHTAARAPGAAAFWQITLDRARPVDECDVVFPEGEAHQWALYAAQSEADMARRAGTFVTLSAPQAARYTDRDQVVFQKPPAYRVYRLECRRQGEGRVGLSDWALWTPQAVRQVEVETFVPNVVPGERIQLQARAILELGAVLNATPDVRWEVAPAGAGRVDDLQRFEAAAVGPARITAVYGGQRSTPLAVEVLAAGQPDWTVTYVELQPRAPGSASPQPGQRVYWFAHVKNYGTANAEPVPFEWRVDGQVVMEGRLPKVERFQQTDVIVSGRWLPGRQTLEMVVDPANEVPETSELNNRLQVFSDAVPVGFWVEDELLRHFHRHQRELGVGSNCWEDWAQRQVSFWNRWMQGGRWLWSKPELAQRRFRLDRVVVVGDGMLPLAPGHARQVPDARDDTVRLAVGLPASGRAGFLRTREATPDNPFFLHGGLLRDLARVSPAGAAASVGVARPGEPQ